METCHARSLKAQHLDLSSDKKDRIFGKRKKRGKTAEVIGKENFFTVTALLYMNSPALHFLWLLIMSQSLTSVLKRQPKRILGLWRGGRQLPF